MQVPRQQPAAPPGWQIAPIGVQAGAGGFVGHGTFGVTGTFGWAATLVMRPDMARLRRVIESGAWKCIIKAKGSDLCSWWLEVRTQRGYVQYDFRKMRRW